MGIIMGDSTTGNKLRYLLASVGKPIPVDRVYAAIFQLKDRFPEEWNEIKFYMGSSGVRSEELERYLSDFNMFGIINKLEGQYSMNNDMRKYQLKQLTSLPKEQQDKIKNMAKSLESFLEE
jgi:hypothetical protein